MQRILVAGITGAGKTTMAQALSARLRLPFHEMDSLVFNGPDWAVDPDLHQQVAKIAAAPAWIFDSFGHPEVRDLLWTSADTVIWLDYPRAVVMPRVLRRSLRRTLLRERVFGGNVETLSSWFSGDHPAWSSWTQYEARRAEINRRTTDPRFAPLNVVHLRSPREATAWLGGAWPRPAAG
ncbi:P-loop NTPase family protein [Streptomyces liliifuscus]|uniref:Adenylate kinase n=1 Tax=Streptomyces liliifuscus TaxID=2797636 RepID=A0A7T7RGE2_9ACTN|nr:adenylate kinase [Streptomyces liliifuscus]QQM45657.1 adenylate kinase [Streptomyces liliifuscus]